MAAWVSRSMRYMLKVDSHSCDIVTLLQLMTKCAGSYTFSTRYLLNVNERHSRRRQV